VEGQKKIQRFAKVVVVLGDENPVGFALPLAGGGQIALKRLDGARSLSRVLGYGSEDGVAQFGWQLGSEDARGHRRRHRVLKKHGERPCCLERQSTGQKLIRKAAQGVDIGSGT
jgi:hypothetical protein